MSSLAEPDDNGALPVNRRKALGGDEWDTPIKLKRGNKNESRRSTRKKEAE